ncbi:hypothetical protein RvY_16789 [Ramazzottius varieornatus]|uniref:G-protein coupled receptors family 2 profile 2 domain-containing protein n=1 Tax=Ramazzottius varieornatus TaxID=947166 RepID=A0A1D1VZS4_RAMVA|nr:hypothetical protein RvY_16789 [Ramazzottius varieornatus]
MNIYSSLLVSNIAFLITEYMPDTGSENACFAFAVLSHWLILAASGWMIVEHYRIYRITRDVFSAVHEIKNSPSIAASRWTRRWTGFSVWFIPLAVAAFCALIEIDSSVFGGPVYLHKKMWCWMDPHHTVMIALFFVVPLTLAALLNIVVLLYFFTEQRSLSKKVLQDAKRANMNSLLNVTATCGFLAVTWLVGYFVLFSCTDDVTKEIFAYLFVLLNATQGVTVLIIHVYTLPNGFQTIVHEIFPRSTSKEALEAENSDKDLARGVETPPPRKRLGLPRGWSTDTLDTTGSIAASRKDRISPQLTHEKIFKV